MCFLTKLYICNDTKLAMLDCVPSSFFNAGDDVFSDSMNLFPRRNKNHIVVIGIVSCFYYCTYVNIVSTEADAKMFIAGTDDNVAKYFFLVWLLVQFFKGILNTNLKILRKP